MVKANVFLVRGLCPKVMVFEVLAARGPPPWVAVDLQVAQTNRAKARLPWLTWHICKL